MHVSSLNYDIWKAVTHLYLNDPLNHVYLMYDLIYELNKVDIYFQLAGKKIIGYLLIWKGFDTPGVHIWGSTREN